MIASPELSVTLSTDLLRHLRAESRRLKISLQWLVAGMVVDTLTSAEAQEQRSATR